MEDMTAIMMRICAKAKSLKNQTRRTEKILLTCPAYHVGPDDRISGLLLVIGVVTRHVVNRAGKSERERVGHNDTRTEQAL
jgi:hypothetical protein